MKKLHMGQNILIAVLGIATLFFALLLVLSAIPVTTDVRIHQEITVSAFEVEAAESSDTEWRYQVEATGSLRNTTDREVVIERLVIPVSNGSFAHRREMELEVTDLVIPPNTEIDFSAEGTGDADYRYVGEVTAVLDGEEIFLRNPADNGPFAILIPLILTALFAFFTMQSCRRRYYMAQEDRLEALEKTPAEPAS